MAEGLEVRPMIEVFPIVGAGKMIDNVLNEVAFILLIFLFLVSLGFFALNRMDGFNPETKVNQVVVFAVMIGLWPQVMSGLKELVDSLNSYLIRNVFDINWTGFEAIGSIVWEKVKFNNWVGDLLFSSIAKILVYLLDVARLLLYYLFVLFFFFYKILGPFILARGVLTDDFQVLKGLLSEVSILFLWQTTFVLLLGFFSWSMKGAF